MSPDHPEHATDFSSSVLKRIDGLRDAFEDEWLAGRHPDLESYLQQVGPVARHETFNELLRLELYYRSRRGEQLSRQWYLDQFPGDRGLVIDAFRDLVAAETGGGTIELSRSPRGDTATTAVPGTSVSSRDEEARPASSDVAELLRRIGLAPQIQLPDPSSDRLASTLQQGTGDDRSSSDTPEREEIGRYRLEGEVGRGGFGTVYRSRDAVLGRTLALKLSTSHSDLGEAADERSRSRHLEHVSRFIEEAQVTAQLEHPAIVPVHELGIDARGRLFFTMRLIEGRELGEVIDLIDSPDAEWTLPRLVGVLVQACQAVAYAHSRGVIHRDLKPSNIIVGRYGAVYVMDWGLAKVTGREDRCDLRLDAEQSVCEIVSDRRDHNEGDSPLVTMDGTVMGTPAYMSPEQAEGRIAELDQTSDVYALGAILYRVLTGQAPYVKPGSRLSPHAIVGLVATSEPRRVQDLNPRAPPQLAAICEKAMARDQRRRYSSSLEMAGDLQAFLEDRVVRAFRTGAVAEFGSWVKRNRPTAWASAAAVLFLVLGLATALMLQRRSNQRIESSMQLVEISNSELSATNEELVAAQDELEAKSKSQEQLIYQLSVLHLAALRNDPYPVEAAGLLQECPERLRGWEWLRLRHVFARRENTGSPIDIVDKYSSKAALSDDGRRLLIADEQAVRVLDVEKGTAAERRFEGGASRLELLPEGDRFVSLNEGRLSLRSADDGHILWSKEVDGATSLAVSPDGNRVATGAGDGRVHLWDTATAERTSPPEAESVAMPSAVRALAFSPGSGKLAAVMPQPSTVDVTSWDFQSGSVRRRTLTCPVGPEWDPEQLMIVLAWSRQGLWVAASDRSRLLLWGPESESPSYALKQSSPVSALTISRDATRVVVGADNGSIQIWNTSRGERVQLLSRHNWTMGDLCLDGMATTLASTNADGTARLWSVGPDTLSLRGQGSEVWCAAFDPLQPRVVTGGFGGGLLQWWDRTSGEELLTVFAHGRGVVWSVVFSPDGRTLASTGQDGTVRLWDASGREIREIQVMEPADKSDYCLFADFSPDGKTLVTGGFDGTIRYWDPQTGTLIRPERRVTTSRIWSVEYFPDGQRVLVCSCEGTRVLAVDDGRDLIPTIENEEIYPRARVSPDGHLILTGGTHLGLWDADTGAMVRPLSNRRAAAWAIDFSPDGRRAIAANDDATISVWDVESGNPLLTLEGHGHGRIAGVAFSPDGTQIISCASDATARIWDTEPADDASRRIIELARMAVEEAIDAAGDPYSLDQVLSELRAIQPLDARIRRAAVRLAHARLDSASLQLALFPRRWARASRSVAPEAAVRQLLGDYQRLLQRDGENPYLLHLISLQQRALGDAPAAASTAARAAEVFGRDPERPTSAYRIYRKLHEPR